MMKKSEIYGIVALVACVGLFVAGGAETLRALLSLGIPSAAVGFYCAIKHRILTDKGE